MRLLISLIFLLSFSFLISCSNCKQTQTGNNNNQNSPAAITQNLSIVEAEVVEVTGSGNDFKVKARIISTVETDAYPSIAVSGEEYILTPNLRTENGKLLYNEINSNLLSLRNLSKGQKFTAEISLDQKTGWLIQRVIK
uniref:Lipoprotein n=1 Tax=Ignavibacterium album TaxID=591197 RepID=A0A7V3E6Q7_9BACT